MKTLLRFKVLVSCLFVGAVSGDSHARAQGWVNFNNQPFTLISTNAIHGGPALGATAGYPGSGQPQFVYGLFAAASTVTSVSGVMDPNWTFAGAYATNITLPGRLVGGTVILPSPYAAGSTWNFLVRGWSSTVAGQDWPTVQAFVSYLETDPNAYGARGQFFGTSGIATFVVGGGASPIPGIFGSTPGGSIQGFVLDQVPTIPEPSVFGLLGLAVAALVILRLRGQAVESPGPGL